MDGANDLRITKNGQKSSLNGKWATGAQIVGTVRYSRAEHHR